MPESTNEGRVYVATQTFIAMFDGAPQVIRAKVTRVREGHPLLAQNPEFFELVGEHVHFDVETTTAAPGEKRSVPSRRGPKDE